MITVQYFASVRESLGRSSEHVPAPSAEVSVKELLDMMAEKDSKLATLLAGERLLYAVNQEMADGSAAVCDGDEVALFPPMTGG